MTRRLLLGAAVALAVPAALAAAAAPDETSAAVQQIEVSARQGLLIEDMAARACLRAAGIGGRDDARAMDEARSAFDTALGGLANGDAGRGLPYVDDPALRAAIERLGAPWRTYAAQIERAARLSDPAAGQLALIAGEARALRMAADEIASAFEGRASGAGVPLHRAIAMGVAARQAALNRQMAKEACLASEGVEATAARAALGEAAGLFGMSLGALTNGFESAGLRPPRNPELKARLAEAATLWAGLGPDYERVAAGGDADLERIAAASADLAAVLDAVVRLEALEGPDAATN